MRKLLLVGCLFFGLKSFAQTDTSFWFAAPDVDEIGNLDRPIKLRFSSYQLSSTVTVSQPANPAFISQTITLLPFSTQSIDLTPQLSIVECKPGNVIQNRGLKVTATNKIAVYYEVNEGAPNPEIFSLKGRNALGTQFYISSQNIINNNFYPGEINPYSSFNIVASEDNTSVTITPSNNITGHSAYVPFTIVLNRGQTYAAEASSQSATQHLDGSYVTSTKPIAITLEDDLLNGGSFYSGNCQDLAGDQTVPFTSLGTEYIAIRSQLNAPYDKVFITATQAGTTVKQDGILMSTLNAGQSTSIGVTNTSTYIQTSLPSYAYQLAGAGCEMASAILPKIDCSGNTTISITRSSPEGLIITLLVKNGGQGSFLINNVAGVITAAQFSVVPGTAGLWYFAKINLSIASYPNGSTVRIDNTASIFQFGFMQGGVLSGLSFGYFSDFNTIRATVTATNPNPCVGTNLTLSAETIPSATYSWSGPNGYTSSSQNPILNNVTIPLSGYYVATVTVPGCGTYKDSINVTVKPKTFSTINQSICQGTTYAGYGASGQYIDIFTGANGCDSTRTLNLTIKPKSFKTISQTICEGLSFETYTTSGTYVNTFVAANGCDSVRTLILTVKPKSLNTITQSICEGQSFEGYTTTGTYANTFVAANGCDSIRTLILTVKPKSLKTITQSICQGQSFEGYTTSGTYVNTFVAANGCDSVRTLILTVKPKTFSTINQTICQGTTYAGYGNAGQYVDIFTGANGCDSTRTLNLTIKPKSFKTIIQTICDGQSFEGYTISGTYVNTFLAANGCDSVRTLNLTVKPKSLNTITQSICEGQSFEGYTTTGTYANTFVAANGCDSIRTLILTVKPKSLKTITQSICQGQSFEGYITSGTYVNTFVAANGCDSVRTLILTVKPKTFSTINQTICQGTTYAGYGNAGQYVDIFTGANGCDSTRTLNLTIKPKSFKTIIQTICDGQSFEGYITSGTYVNTFLAANGCDSVRTLNLTVKPKSNFTLTKIICEGDIFEGYNTTGNYTNTFVAANGCDSVRILNLTVLKFPMPNLGPDISVCFLNKFLISPGFFDSYLWQDGSSQNIFSVTKAGLYFVKVTNACGFAVDSIIISNKSCDVFFPNVFTPNGDTKNDFFKILNATNLAEYKLAIYNRWGEKVFETNNYTTGWDGNYKGSACQVGSYVWHCNFIKEGRQKSMKGSVLLLR